MVKKVRIEHMIDVADELIGLLVDRRFDPTERRAILCIALVLQAKALGQSHAEIADSLGQLYDLCDVGETGLQ